MALNISGRPAPRPRRTMLYGPHGIGKSTFGAMAPKPIFIQTEDGIGDIECDRFPLCQSFDKTDKVPSEHSFLGQFYSLFVEEHQFRTLVIDSADWLEALIHRHVADEANVKSIGDIGFGKGYPLAANVWRTVLEGCDSLVSRGIGVIIVAHAKVIKFNDPAGDAYDRYSPKLHDTSSALLQEWADEVLFATHKVFTKQEDQGFNKTRTVPIAGGGRVLKTEEAPSHLAKNRLNMPPEIGFSYGEYAAHFRKA